MPRRPGDTNFTPRERKFRAANQTLEAKLAVAKAKLKERNAMISELRVKLHAAGAR